jgi:hypothetical protein
LHFNDLFFILNDNVMKNSAKKNERPEAYPKPTETDAQMKNQDEYTERQSGRRSEDMPMHGGKQQASEPKRANAKNGGIYYKRDMRV